MTFWGLVEQGNVFYPGFIEVLFSFSLPTTSKMSYKWVLGISSQKQQGPRGLIRVCVGLCVKIRGHFFSLMVFLGSRNFDQVPYHMKSSGGGIMTL